MTITNELAPATDLGYLLHKNPGRAQVFDLPFGRAHVFYPESSPERCTAALLLEVDPVGLVRGRGSTLGQYVNDRPYAASSFLSVAISRVFGSALSGKSRDRPELATTALPLRARLAVVPCRSGEDFLRRLFEPLGYEVSVEAHALDETVPDWGESPYFTVEISGLVRLRDLLSHLYVLVPVLDDDKHYWVGDDEVEKLLRRGEGWLTGHPEKEAITARYLKHQRSLARDALERLVEDEDPEVHDREEEAVEEKARLSGQRVGAVLAALKGAGARRVIDLGCGEGKLLRALFEDRGFGEIVGMDVSHRLLEAARRRLRLDELPDNQRGRLGLFQGSLTYRDERLSGFDAATLVEVVEHLDPHRLAAFERVVFEFARPRTVVLTTPNAEYNPLFEGLPAGEFRHRDHSFEWTREEFRAWAGGVCGRHGYAVRFVPVGPEDPRLGAPTQMGVFEVA
nr:3' terminal RNA ribose 2'-O-methyltransferase Hen1 [Rubrobacter tropicus]